MFRPFDRLLIKRAVELGSLKAVCSRIFFLYHSAEKSSKLLPTGGSLAGRGFQEKLVMCFLKDFK